MTDHTHRIAQRTSSGPGNDDWILQKNWFTVCPRRVLTAVAP